MRELPAPDARAAALASRQDGVLTLDDALRCGLTADQVRRRLQAGRWEQLVRGVYRLTGAPDTWRQRARAAQAAVAAAGGAASHATAVALHGLGRPSPLPHVTVPPSGSARCPIAKVHRHRLELADLGTVDGIRVTSVTRTLVDLAGVLARPELEQVVDAALCQQLVSVASTLRALDRTGAHRRGRALLRSVLEVWTATIEPGSQAEVRLLRRLAEWGIETPVTQHEIRDDAGAFVARVDAAWPHRLVAVEYEGLRHHAARRFDVDERRYERIRALGWRLTAADKSDLLPGARRLPDLLKGWLAARGAA